MVTAEKTYAISPSGVALIGTNVNYNELPDRHLRSAYGLYNKVAFNSFEGEDLGGVEDIGHKIADAVVKRAGGLEKVTSWVENKKGIERDRFAKRKFLNSIKKKQIESFEEIVPYISEYFSNFGEGLKIELSHSSGRSGSDGSVSVQDIYKILECTFEGMGFNYDNSREYLKDIDQDMKDRIRANLNDLTVEEGGNSVMVFAD